MSRNTRSRANRSITTATPRRTCAPTALPKRRSGFSSEKRHSDNRFHGRRVELNQFTSDQMVEWLEAKLRGHRVSKVIPGRTARWSNPGGARSNSIELNKQLKKAAPEARRAARARRVPVNLSKRIAKMLKEDPALAWDEALSRLMQADEGGE